MNNERYKETIDYKWVIAKQLDRVLYARSKINNYMMRFDYELSIKDYEAALTALWLALPSKIKNVIEQPNGSLYQLDNTLSRIMDELDKNKLLLRKSNVPIGGEVEEDDEV